MNKLITLLILTIYSFPSYAWDASVIIGKWESYSYSFGHTYKRIVINDNYSGSYTQLSGNERKFSASFNKDNFTFHDGYAVLNLDETFSFVLSAWGKRISGTSQRLLGQQLIYRTEGKEKKLINSISLSLTPADDESIIKFIQEVSKELESTTNK